MNKHLAEYGLEPHECKTVKAGDRFGRITILAVGKLPGTYKYRAVYRCDCGTEKCVQIGSIQIGTTKSCGCASADRMRTHGLWNDPLSIVWRHMVNRCTDPNDEHYANYGARGITVCPRWMDLTAFHSDMAPTYVPGLTLDRRDNAQGYSPANCHWITPMQQARNKRNNILVTIDDRTMILKDWCHHYGVNYHTVYHRINAMGWEPIRALTTPSLRPRR